MKSLAKNLVFFCLLFLQSSSVLAQAKYDYIIKDITYYDGSSIRARKGDVAIKGERIVKIGDLSDADAKEFIRAKDHILTPGFIDAHTHSDFNPVVYPHLHHKVAQGVTTEVTGNCGMSAAPVFGFHQEKIKGVWSREGVQIPKQVEWQSFAQYREALQKKGLSTHFLALIGHGNLRSAVMGFSPRVAGLGEIEEMKKRLDQAMQEGAGGISFGLVYLPGIFAQHDELVELCKVAARYSGICSFHLRSEGSQVIEALREAIRVGEEAKAFIQISHLKVGGKKNWSKLEDVFKEIEEARFRGVQIAADAYPYTAGFAELGVTLPEELYQREDRVGLFKNLFKRKELVDELREYYDARSQKWDRIIIAATPHKKWQKYEGKTIKEIARSRDIEPEKFLVEILAGTSFEVSAFYFSQKRRVVERVIQKPYVAVGSDSVADGIRKPHPRVFGTFPKLFRIFERERKSLSVGEIVKKMTHLPAIQYGLAERGEIKEGYYADLVILDPKEFEDKSTYEKPTLLPYGAKWVFVNGYPVVRRGRITQEKKGQFLKPERSELRLLSS